MAYFSYPENASIFPSRFSAGQYRYWTEHILLRFLLSLFVSSGLLPGDCHASRGLTDFSVSILFSSTIQLLFTSDFLGKPETNSNKTGRQEYTTIMSYCWDSERHT